MKKMNRVNFNIEYDVKPGTQINIVIVEGLPDIEDDDGGPSIGFHADITSPIPDDLLEDEEEEGEEDEEEELEEAKSPKKGAVSSTKSRKKTVAV